MTIPAFTNTEMGERQQIEVLRALAQQKRQSANYCDRGNDYREAIAEAVALQQQVDEMEYALNQKLLAEINAELNADAE